MTREGWNVGLFEPRHPPFSELMDFTFEQRARESRDQQPRMPASVARSFSMMRLQLSWSLVPGTCTRACALRRPEYHKLPWAGRSV